MDLFISFRCNFSLLSLTGCWTAQLYPYSHVFATPFSKEQNQQMCGFQAHFLHSLYQVFSSRWERVVEFSFSFPFSWKCFSFVLWWVYFLDKVNGSLDLFSLSFMGLVYFFCVFGLFLLCLVVYSYHGDLSDYLLLFPYVRTWSTLLSMCSSFLSLYV